MLDQLNGGCVLYCLTMSYCRDWVLQQVQPGWGQEQEVELWAGWIMCK